MHEFCKEFTGKKCTAGDAVDLEVVDLLGTNSSNKEITNERCSAARKNGDEGSAVIDNERYGMPCKNSNEGSTTFASERRKTSQSRSDKGSAPIAIFLRVGRDKNEQQ